MAGAKQGFGADVFVGYTFRRIHRHGCIDLVGGKVYIQ